MRVITGSARGRRLKTVGGRAVRPTADRVKEALFSIVASRFDLDGARVLDLFAGSGALGIEALSRGAAHATFVEPAEAALRVLRENVDSCGFTERSRVLRMSGERALRQLEGEEARFDGVLMDPPYGHGLVDEVLRRLGSGSLLGDTSWVMAEHHLEDDVAAEYGKLQLTQRRRYGKTGLALFSASA